MCKVRQDRMRMLTDSLKDYNEGTDVGFHIRELEVVRGKAIAINLFRPADNSIATAHTKIEPNTEFPIHYHSEKEIITVFRGEITMYFVDPKTKKVVKEVKLIKGECLLIKPGIEQSHYAISEKGCEVVVITVPASKGFPK